MSDRRMDTASSLEALSALVDGEANEAETVRACHAWRDDHQVRDTWAQYQLISDVLKSDDLALDQGRADFLDRFRSRLANEPVVLAPAVAYGRTAPQMADSGAADQVAVGSDVVMQPLRRRTWTGPVAVAACFVAVVGVLVLQGRGALGDVGMDAQMAASAGAPRPAAGERADVALASAAAPADVAQSSQEGTFMQVGHHGRLEWRDPQLDQALMSQQAEHSFASRGGALRTVAFEAP